MADKVRAEKQPAEKVLRIGIVQDGRVIQERLIKPGQSVTIGDSPKNTFVFAGKGLPRRFTLFQARGKRYVLQFTEGMKGKIAHKGGIAGLDDLRSSGDASRKGDAWVLPLHPRHRGKIEIDGVTVLFQFVSAPPESARMVHRQDFRPRLFEEDDPVFFGFLALWAAIATVFVIYALNTEPVEMMPLEAIPDRFVEVVLPPKEPKKPEEQPKIEDLDKGTKIAREEKKPEPGKGEKAKAKKPMTAKERKIAEARRIEERRKQLLKKSTLLAAIIGTRGETTSDKVVQDVFADSDHGFQDLQQALQQVDGVAVADEANIGIKRQTAGGGRADANIGDLAKTGGGSADVGSIEAKAPSGKADIGTIQASVSGAQAEKMRATIRRYQGQIRYCYEKRLKENPNISGRVVADVDINGGRVTNVLISENSTGDTALAQCIQRKIRTWRFPSDLTDLVSLPFVLTPSS